MRAVLYCRVSTVEQTQNLSLPTQEKACREFARREGYTVAEVFVDRGESAKTTDRPEFQRLLAYCRQQTGKVHAVIVYGLSRFSRNSADHHAIAALLRGRGVALRSVTEPIDDSPAGRFMEGICAAMAQFDNDLRADRSKVGMRAAAERGRWVWRPPTGYRTGVRSRGEPSLVIDDTQGPIVRTAFTDLATTDRAVADVWRAAVAAGLKGHQGPPGLAAMHYILRNPAYIGRLRSKGLGTSAVGDWAPLVSEAIWLRVQARFQPVETAPARRRVHPDFPLRRFVFCGTCGGPLTGAWSTGRSAKYGYYECRKRCVSARKDALEATFLAFLEQARPSADFLALLGRTALESYRAARGEAHAHRQRLEGEANKVRAQLDRIDSLLIDRVIDQETYRTRRDDGRDRLALIELELSQAVVDTLNIEGALAAAEYAIQNGATLWTGAVNAEQRERLQWALFPDGLVWSGSALSNRGSVWTCYEIPAADAAVSELVALIGPSSNRIDRWAAAWAAYLAA